MSFRVPDFEPVPGTEPPRRGRAARRMGAVLLLFMAAGLIAAVVAVFLSLQSGTDIEPGKRVSVTIPAGADANRVADILAEQGVVSNKTTFKARLRWNGDGAGFKSGTYDMTTGSSYEAIVAKLEKGPPPAPTFDMGFPEGYRITEMASAVDKAHTESKAEGQNPAVPAFDGKQYVAVAQGARVPAKYEPPAGTTSLEGFLFPATYELRKSADARALVQKQLDAFAQNFDSIDLTRARKANLTPYEVVIIASMVEREARVPSERARVAGVIYNRLREGMTLGIDATIQYAVAGTGDVAPDEWETDLKVSQLEIDSPYNTRKNAGLPPTPIANPGLDSLQAAANPEEHAFLYYVAKPDGSGEHFFTETYDEFLAKQ